MFAPKRILYFTAEDHYLYRSHGGALELEAKFSGDDIGVTAFRDHLRGQRRALYSVLADLAGEDFHEEQVPYLRGSDRDAVVQRRLAQRYRDTRLAAALSLGQVAGERRNERLLLTSFTNTQQLAPWLDALEETGASHWSQTYTGPMPAPGSTLELVAFVKGEKIQDLTAGGRVFIGLKVFPMNERESVASAVFDYQGDVDWVLLKATLENFPEDAESIQVTLYMPRLTLGKVYFDEINLTVK